MVLMTSETRAGVSWLGTIRAVSRWAEELFEVGGSVGLGVLMVRKRRQPRWCDQKPASDGSLWVSCP